jgi:hypothetical protein
MIIGTTERHQITQEAPGVIRLMFQYRERPDSERPGFGETGRCIRVLRHLYANLPREPALRPEAMVRNATMSIGALGLVEGTVILPWSAPLKDLDADEFDVLLQGLAIVGDMLEQAFSGADRF